MFANFREKRQHSIRQTFFAECSYRAFTVLIKKINQLHAGTLGSAFNFLLMLTMLIYVKLKLYVLFQNFLRCFFKLFDLENNNYLKQDQWIEHIKGRLMDEKQIDFAEQIESVTYVICGENKIDFDKFCQIWKAKGVRILKYVSLKKKLLNNCLL
jgi:hypothetical protein